MVQHKQFEQSLVVPAGLQASAVRQVLLVEYGADVLELDLEGPGTTLRESPGQPSIDLGLVGRLAVLLGLEELEVGRDRGSHLSLRPSHQIHSVRRRAVSARLSRDSYRLAVYAHA